MSIKDNIIPHIRECKTSHETWETLKGLYETTNTNRVLFLKSKLLSIKMEENENISNFLSRIKDLKDKLGDIGENISSTDLVTITLNSMLDEYQMFITGLATREKAPTFDELTGILLQEERRKNLNGRSHNSDLALVAKGKQPYKGKSWRRNKGGRPHSKLDNGRAPPSTNTNVKKNEGCYYCGKFGHYAKDCRRRKFNESKYNKHSGNFVDKGARVCDDFKNLKLFVSDAALSADNDDANAWFIDSGASIHMSCNRNWFDTYHENINDVHKIYLGDDRSHEIKGYGDLSVTLPTSEVKQIHNVMYVPGIKKNLISVSTIANQDLKVEFVKSQCVVKDIQDHYKIIARGSRVGGLYKLDVTRKDHQALASTTMSMEELWHQRYGHLNHNDLMMPQKKEMVEVLPMFKSEHVECEGCALGKQRREEFPMHIDKRKR
jgi:hypothetical protein